MAFHGDPTKRATRDAAPTCFAQATRLDKVREVLNDMPTLRTDEREAYLSMLVNEKIIEDILEHNISRVEPGMTLLHRQLETEVGRIDLPARDRNGTLTVIELKKGRTDDEVHGQLSRCYGRPRMRTKRAWTSWNMTRR